MGIHVYAAVEKNWIHREAWARFYEDSLTVLRGWPDPPMRLRRKTVAGVEVILYSRDCVDPEKWQVSGDANSRRFAESNWLVRDFGVDEPSPASHELLLRVVDGAHPRRLLGNKTQGYAIHDLMVAIAMLAEHRFPGAVVSYGDIDRYDVKRAHHELTAILNEDITWPLCCDEQRLRASLRPHRAGEALDQAVSRLRATDYGWAMRVLDQLESRGGAFAPSLREQCVRARTWTCESSGSPEFLAALEQYLEQAVERSTPARFESLDAEASLATIALGCERVRMTLTEMAWVEIESACLEELHMLAALAQLERVNLGIELGVACFENPLVRMEALRRWRGLRSRAS